MAIWIPEKKISETTTEEVKLPWDVIADPPTIPDVSGKANLSGGNNWTGTQQFNNGSYYFATASDRFLTVEDEDGNAYISMNSDGFDLDHDGLGRTPFMVAEDAGTSGQVLTSQGAGNTPRWTTPAIKSATLTGTTLTLMLP